MQGTPVPILVDVPILVGGFYACKIDVSWYLLLKYDRQNKRTWTFYCYRNEKLRTKNHSGQKELSEQSCETATLNLHETVWGEARLRNWEQGQDPQSVIVRYVHDQARNTYTVAALLGSELPSKLWWTQKVNTERKLFSAGIQRCLLCTVIRSFSACLIAGWAGSLLQKTPLGPTAADDVGVVEKSRS